MSNNAVVALITDEQKKAIYSDASTRALAGVSMKNAVLAAITQLTGYVLDQTDPSLNALVTIGALVTTAQGAAILENVSTEGWIDEPA